MVRQLRMCMSCAHILAVGPTLTASWGYEVALNSVELMLAESVRITGSLVSAIT